MTYLLCSQYNANLGAYLQNHNKNLQKPFSSTIKMASANQLRLRPCKCLETLLNLLLVMPSALLLFFPSYTFKISRYFRLVFLRNIQYYFPLRENLGCRHPIRLDWSPRTTAFIGSMEYPSS